MNKRFLSVAASTAIMASAIVFTGCGSSSSSTTTTTTTTAAGSNTGTFVKGLWSGVPYTYANGTKSGTTGGNGTFTYNTGDTVQFDLGLVKVNATGGSTISVTDSNVILLDAANSDAVIANGAANATVVSNLMAAMLVIAGNQTTIESANGFNAATAITNLKALKAKGLTVVDTTLGGFLNKLDLNMTAANVSKATGALSQYSVSQTDADSLKSAVIATAAKAKAGTAATTGTLNSTRINNTVLKFSDGSFVRFTQNLNNTNVSGLTGGTSYGMWNASGTAIKLGATNMSAYNTSIDTLTLSSLASGATATFVVGVNGSTITKTLSAVYLDASTIVNSTWGFTTAQYNLNFTAGTWVGSNATTNITVANGTQFVSGASSLNATTAGAYNETLRVSPGNASCELNLTFDRDFTLAGNRGVISDIYVTVSSLLTTLAGYIKSVFTSVLGAA